MIIITVNITVAQQNVYLKNNETGHLKKLKKKMILTFETSDSTSVTGRIIAVTDSSFSVSTFEKKEPDTIILQLKSITQIENK
jgi:hypothetical protein